MDNGHEPVSQRRDRKISDDYFTRLNRAIDYIYSHSSEDLSLAKIAEAACFSKYHFHRVFRAVFGETVNEFVNRIRLEKALGQIIYHPSKPITEIAFDFGYSSSQNFARSFKTHYGMPPSQMRAESKWQSWLKKMENIKSKETEELLPDEVALTRHYVLQRKLSLEKILSQSGTLEVEVKKIPSYRLAYIRNWGPYNFEDIDSSFTQLLKWAIPRGLLNDRSLVIGVALINPDFSPPQKLIYDACITVPESTAADRWVNIQYLQGGDCAVYRCKYESHRQEEEWMRFVLHWLAKSEYQPDDRLGFAVYHERIKTASRKYIVADLCLPVKPLLV